MSKHASIAATAALAVLVSLPAAANASDCLGLHRVRDGSVAVVKRVGDGMYAWEIGCSAGSSADIDTFRFIGVLYRLGDAHQFARSISVVLPAARASSEDPNFMPLRVALLRI